MSDFEKAPRRSVFFKRFHLADISSRYKKTFDFGIGFVRFLVFILFDSCLMNTIPIVYEGMLIKKRCIKPISLTLSYTVYMYYCAYY